MIDVFQPEVGDAELAAVGDVLSSKWLGRGERSTLFEQAFADYVGRPAAEFHSLTSCTEGVFHLISALGIGPGDDVVLPTISFIGTAHAVHASGARMVLCDVDPATLNPTRAHVEAAVTPATKAIIVLHFGGDPGSVGELATWARAESLLLIEDAATGLGSTVDGKACGTVGDAGLWSFDAMKVLTTGDGGMVWSRDPAVLAKIQLSTSLGLGPSGFRVREESSAWWEIDPQLSGRRGAMHSIAAAIGLVQLGKLEQALRRRREISSIYDAAFATLDWLSIPDPPPSAARVFYWVQCTPQIRDRLARHLLEREIYTTFKYWPLHRTRMYGTESSFPGADDAAASTLLLPLHGGLSDTDSNRVAAAVREFHEASQ